MSSKVYFLASTKLPKCRSVLNKNLWIIIKFVRYDWIRRI